MATRRSRHHDPNHNRPMFHPRNFKYSAANDSIEPDQKTFENSGIPYLPANDMRDYPVEQSKPVEPLQDQEVNQLEILLFDLFPLSFL